MAADDTYQVVIVKYGTRTSPRSHVFLHHDAYGEPDTPIETAYFFWVVRGHGHTIVVDTGFSDRGGAARGRTMLIRPRDALGHLGIDPSAVPVVVITHAHYDHAGNLADLAAAQVVLCRAEWEFWNSPVHRHRLFHMLVEDEDLDQLRAIGDAGRLTLFDDSHRIADGIDVERVGGHTPGQSMVRVRTDEGTVLLTSDVVHFHEELDRSMPFAHLTDLTATYAGLDRVRSLASSGTVDHVVTGHDPGTLASFRPMDGPLHGLAATIGGTA